MRRRSTQTGQPDAPDPRKALDRHFADRYRELRRIAAGLKRQEQNLTINPTALVNEAWLRLSGTPELGMLTAAHFKALAARAMRRILTDAARHRDAQKRPGGAGVVFVAFDAASAASLSAPREVLALEDALQELARIEPRQASVVEGRYFGGLTLPELAHLHAVSEATIERDWRVARAFLQSRLRPE